ncbi:MAG: hypothetical protein KKA81_08415 [Bacteroidetes bacterium]|nr:hypothetical protein [Bacteroidota bacterium]
MFLSVYVNIRFVEKKFSPEGYVWGDSGIKGKTGVMNKFYEIDYLFDELYLGRASTDQTRQLVNSILEDPEIYEYCKFSKEINDELYTYIFVKNAIPPKKPKRLE